MPEIDKSHPPVGLLQGLREIADCYDGFILDQWGVLHNGQVPYPGAINCLLQLCARQKLTLIVSNSGKRGYLNENRLDKLGFKRESYSQLITSGDVAWEELRTRSAAFYERLGCRCLLFSNDNDRSIVEGLSLEVVSEVDQADFIILAGLGRLGEQDARDRLLKRAADRHLPMLCANPDISRLVHGGLAPSCGAIARRYEQLGGQVRYIGKPHPEIYAQCRSILERGGARRIVAIGDSVQHDIAGGNRAGFDTLFIADGIHHAEFQGTSDDHSKRALLAELVGRHESWPKWMLPSLCW